MKLKDLRKDVLARVVRIATDQGMEWVYKLNTLEEDSVLELSLRQSMIYANSKEGHSIWEAIEYGDYFFYDKFHYTKEYKEYMAKNFKLPIDLLN